MTAGREKQEGGEKRPSARSVFVFPHFNKTLEWDAAAVRAQAAGTDTFFVLTTNNVMCIILKERENMQPRGRSTLALRKLYSKEEKLNCCGCCCCPEM